MLRKATKTAENSGKLSSGQASMPSAVDRCSAFEAPRCPPTVFTALHCFGNWLKALESPVRDVAPGSSACADVSHWYHLIDVRAVLERAATERVH